MLLRAVPQALHQILWAIASFPALAAVVAARAFVPLAAAQAENDRLQAEKTHLGELPYIEKLAREELGMTGAGELPYAPGRRANGN